VNLSGSNNCKFFLKQKLKFEIFSETTGKLSVSLTDENNSTNKCRLQTDRNSEKVFSCDLRTQGPLKFIKIEIEENPVFVQNVTVTLRSGMNLISKTRQP
jgi:hypothetical protein